MSYSVTQLFSSLDRYSIIYCWSMGIFIDTAIPWSAAKCIMPEGQDEDFNRVRGRGGGAGGGGA